LTKIGCFRKLAYDRAGQEDALSPSTQSKIEDVEAVPVLSLAPPNALIYPNANQSRAMGTGTHTRILSSTPL
jgi:hypothetical protein